MARADLAQPVFAGVVACITGFASSFALVLTGLRAVGADDDQAASGLLALCVVTGALALVLSLALRLPLSFAWSTPGAAVLVTAGATTSDFRAAVGAFLVAGLLVVLTGLWPWLARTITRIPLPIASAMLAGILFPICLAPVQAAVQLPLLALPAIAVWLVLYRLAPRWAVPGAVVATAVAVVLDVSISGRAPEAISLAPVIVPVLPVFDPGVLVGLALPLYIVTMAGQNVPGFAVLATFGYRAPGRPMLLATGIGTLAAAPFGGHIVNLSAITAAMTAGPDAHPDPHRRWIATVSSGTGYILLGLGAGAAGALVSVSPPILITAVAGLALLGALTSAVVAALEEPTTRIVAIATFLTCASGVVIGGIGSAFWGLVVGAVLMAVVTLGRRARPHVAPAPSDQESPDADAG